MDYDKFQVGDHVIIKHHGSDTRTIGKVEEVFEEDWERKINFNEFYFPEKTSSKI